MTATFGRIGEFEPEKEDWTSYVERLGHFFHANGIDDDDKKRLGVPVGHRTRCIQASAKSPITRETRRQVLQVPDRDDDKALRPCPLRNSAEV